MEMNTKNFLIGCISVVLALGTIIGGIVFYSAKDIDNNKEIAKVCVAAGGSWTQNSKGDFECRK